MVNYICKSATAAPAHPGIDQVWAWLREIADPEIPIVSIVDLGIVREVAWSGDSDTCTVTVTPTYSGCPATAIIQSRIREELLKHGVPRVELQIRLSPAWTTDWLSPRVIEVLRELGIAPPDRSAHEPATVLPVPDSAALHPQPACPRCGSTRTTLISQFGSTLCKALYRCEECLEPFDYFKPH